MVLFIKSELTNTSILSLCKSMINIEHNKTIFDENGEFVKINDRKLFNNYKIEQIVYNISVSSGVLLIYSDTNSTKLENSCFIDKLIKCIDEIENEYKIDCDEIEKIININYNKSTTYTILTKKIKSCENQPNDLVTRRFFNNSNLTYDNSNTFTWTYKFVQSYEGYLNISELCTKIPNELYLMRSISTIICDSDKIFNVKNMTKQIDYPSLDQYNMFINNKIICDQIYISMYSGLSYEIIKYFNKDNCVEIYNKGWPNRLPTYDENMSNRMLPYNQSSSKYKVTTRDIKKEWHEQLSECINTTNSIYDNNKICTNGICFITGVPLYDNALVLKVIYNNDDNTIRNILINCYVYQSLFTCDKISFLEYFIKSKIHILEVNKFKYSRSEIDVISMISDNLINPIKKELMEAICINGIYVHDKYSEKMIARTANLKTNKIFIGLPNIKDSDIIKYQNTNTILFNIVLI